VRGEGDISAHRWVYGARVLSNQIPRATWRNTLMYRLAPELQLGIEFNPLAQDVRPLANWRLLRESPTRPAVVFGTSSDRIGTPSGQAYYVTLAKSLEPSLGLPITPYVGMMYGEWEDRLVFPAGATLHLGRGLALQPLYDGYAFHAMASYAWDRYSITGILIRARDPGIAFTIGF
jgi:hypothetical protein